jgi:hypothetical protein
MIPPQGSSGKGLLQHPLPPRVAGMREPAPEANMARTLHELFGPRKCLFLQRYFRLTGFRLIS